MLISKSALIVVLVWASTSANAVTFRKPGNERNNFKGSSKQKAKKPPPRPVAGETGGNIDRPKRPATSSVSASSPSQEEIVVPGYQAETTWATYPPEEESPVQVTDPYPGQETNPYSGQETNPYSGQVSNPYPQWVSNQNPVQENTYPIQLPNPYAGQGQMSNLAPATYPTERHPVAGRYPVADRYQAGNSSPVANSGSVTYRVPTSLAVTYPVQSSYGASYPVRYPVRSPVRSPVRYSASFPVGYPVQYPIATVTLPVSVPAPSGGVGSTYPVVNTYNTYPVSQGANTYPGANMYPSSNAMYPSANAIYPSVNTNLIPGSSNMGLLEYGTKKKRRVSGNKKTGEKNIFETLSVTPPRPARKTKKPIEFRQRITRTPVQAYNNYQYSNQVQPSNSYQYPSQVQDSASYQYQNQAQNLQVYVRATPYPTRQPTPYPTRQPTPYPTRQPTPYPTLPPTPIPTPIPTLPPTKPPTPIPTPIPTLPPTKPPTLGTVSVGVPVQEPIVTVTFPAATSYAAFPIPSPVSVSVTPPVSTTVTGTDSPTLEEENWITTDLATYAPGDPVYVAWYRAEPQIGDHIKFTVYDSDILEYRTVFTHSLCEQEGCPNTSVNGELEANPNPQLEPEFYYVSLYDIEGNELSYIDIVVE